MVDTTVLVDVERGRKEINVILEKFPLSRFEITVKILSYSISNA